MPAPRRASPRPNPISPRLPPCSSSSPRWSEDPALERALPASPTLSTALTATGCRRSTLLAGARSLYVVGRGPGFGAAQEAALKLKETGGLHAEALSSAELCTGPLALAGPDFPVMLFSQNDAALGGLAELGAELAAAACQ